MNNTGSIWRRASSRFFSLSLAVLLLLSLGAAGCGDGGRQKPIRITVRIQGFTPAELANARSMALSVIGDSVGSDGGAADDLIYGIVAGELADGEMQLTFIPKTSNTKLRIRVALIDGTGKEMGAGTTDTDRRMVDIVIELVPSIPVQRPDGGVDADAPDAAPPDASAERPTVCAASICSGTLADGCCPSACTAASDTDCTGCGNGRMDPGETCDPPGSCPVCDDQNDCTTDTSTGAASTCNLVCAHEAKTCSLAGSDKCCPQGCAAATDSDCAACGDGVVDPAAGETCDPATSCPAAASCTPTACWDTKTFTGSAATCNARCSTVRKVCSGTTRDDCCPPGCNTSAQNRDVDCTATCGNGVVEAGETCDPPGSCPECDDRDDCTADTATGSAATCNLVCGHAAKTCSMGGNDRCCPMGCTATNDSDCAGCGDGTVDSNAGETCDPPGSCPTAPSCVPTACWDLKTFTGAPDSCNARCATAMAACSGSTSDGCCPPGCNTSRANLDVDCPAQCGNSSIEKGETCDPPGTCPVCDDQNDCTTDTSTGTAATCNLVCAHAAKTCSTAGNDRCCPAGCTALTDSDCAACGDGVIDPSSGETCDPPSSCPLPATCPASDCPTVRRYTGSPDTCNARCAVTPVACSGDTADRCCPTGCNQSSSNVDVDCPAFCGNGRVESGERCDPLTSCPTMCSMIVCDKFKLDMGATCSAQCVADGVETMCKGGDGCCPPGCNATNDNNCVPMCGNGVREGNELCDGVEGPNACPTACPAMGCQLRTLEGAGTCQARCVNAGMIQACASGDSCCGMGGSCNSTNDTECGIMCGNGVIETGELCDGNCPTSQDSCPVDRCRLRTFTGTACSRECVDAGPVQLCANGDSCCGAGPTCNANNDDTCNPVCGNNAVERGELCDGNCPSDCPPVSCGLRMLVGTGCNRECVAVGPVTECKNGDGCCWRGSAAAPACNANNDNNCDPLCNNGVLETNETCEPIATCQTRYNACREDRDTVRVGSGDPAICTFVCTERPRECGPRDGFCPASCPRINTDPDCVPDNDTCAGARDISEGGIFPVDFNDATKKDLEMLCRTGPDGPEVFFGFRLEQQEYAYLAVLSADDKAVPLSLEHFSGEKGCPTGSDPRDCSDGDATGKACQRASFPALEFTGIVGRTGGLPLLGPGLHVIAVRAPAGTIGRWNLFFEHVPAMCAQGGLLGAAPVTPNTCQTGEHLRPICGPAAGTGPDQGYVVVKCPTIPLSLTACGLKSTPPVLSARWGSLKYDAEAKSCVRTGTIDREECGVAPPGSVCQEGVSLEFTHAIPGLVTVFVDSTIDPKTQSCGDIRLTLGRATTPALSTDR